MIEFETMTPGAFFDRPEVPALVAEYAKECANPAFGYVPPDVEAYKRLDALGMVRGIVALDAGKVVGFASVLVSPIPHFAGKLIATFEGVYLRPEYRRGSAGLRLIRAAKQAAKDAGAVGLYLTAPAGSRLEKLGALIGRHSNTQFFIEV